MKESELQLVLPSFGFLKDSQKETLKCGRKGTSNCEVFESQAYSDLDQAGCLSLSGRVSRKTLCTDLTISWRY